MGWLATKAASLFSETVKTRIEQALAASLQKNAAALLSRLNSLGEAYWPASHDAAAASVGSDGALALGSSGGGGGGGGGGGATVTAAPAAAPAAAVAPPVLDLD